MISDALKLNRHRVKLCIHRIKLCVRHVKLYLLQQWNNFCKRSSLSGDGKRGESYDRRESARARDVLQEKLPRYAPLGGVTVGVTSQSYSVRFRSPFVTVTFASTPARGWRRATCEVITWEDVKRIRQPGKDFRAKSSTRRRQRGVAWCALSPVRYPSRRARDKNVLQYWRW